jgi:hypothetical protein
MTAPRRPGRRGGRARRLAASALPLALAAPLVACEPELAPCEGQPLATLRFTQSGAGSSGCAFAAAPSGVDFVATLTSLPGGRTGLCVQLPLGQTKVGTLALDVLSVGSTELAQTVGSCPCAVDVAETLQGTVRRAADGTIEGFSGELVDEVSLSPRPSGAPACAPATEGQCAPLVGAPPDPGAERCSLRAPVAGER